MKNSTNILLIAAIAIGAYFYLNKNEKKEKLLSVGFPQSVVNQMSGSEIDDVYTLLTKYNGEGVTVPEGDLKNRLRAISNKYNVMG